jgi:hypothetical protein
VKKPQVYYLQNQAIHHARVELEAMAIFESGRSLEAVRVFAGRINLGIESISRLSLKQREILIDKLRELGATVRNPHIYESDLTAEHAASGAKGGRKIVLFSEPKEEQLRMLDVLASGIRWNTLDGYLRFCYKLLKCPRPRNSKEVTKLRLALQSILDQQRKKEASQHAVAPADPTGDRQEG